MSPEAASSASEGEGAPEAPTPAVEALNKQHRRKDFLCAAAPELQEYLQKTARQDSDRDAGQTFVAAFDNGTIVGYYTLSSLSIELQDLPQDSQNRLPRYPVVPAAMLGRLAVDDRYARQGYGEFLLMDAFKRTARLSEQIAIYAVITEPRDEKARTFYENFDFLAFPERTDRLFIPMKTVRKLF